MKNQISKLKENEIEMYFHCSECNEENSKPYIECGFTPKGLQVRCITHNINIIKFDFMGNKVKVL